MDRDERYIPRSGPMFSSGGLAKADLATNLAIPLLAEGGWTALTLRTVARAANVTPQAIAAWFPSVGAMRAAIARRYGERWIGERSYQAYRRILLAKIDGEVIDLPQVARALLPATWVEEAFDGVWLTVVEAGRWDVSVGAAVSAVRQTERDLVADLLSKLDDPDEERLARDVDLVLAIVQGLRVARTSPQDSMSAERTAEVLRLSLSGGR